MNQRPGGAPNVALKATSITLYERIRAAAARSKVTTNPNKAQYDPDLVKCHLCPKVGTFSVVRQHIVKYHSEQPLQTEQNKKHDHPRSSPPPQRQQGGSDSADLTESAKPTNRMVEKHASHDDNTTGPAARKFRKCSPQNVRIQLPVQNASDGYDPPVLLQQNPTTEQNSIPQNDDTSVNDPEATVQILGQLNFPPINPENQIREIENNVRNNVANPKVHH